MSANSENLNGIILMTLAMLAFAIDDMFLKLLTKTVPIGQSMFLMGIGSSVVFYILVKRSGGTILSKSLFEFPMLLRSAGDLVGTFGMFIALALIPLTTVAAIMQALPLLVILAAVFFLNEKVGLKRWIAVISGIFGMLLIVKPGTETFNIHTLFAVIGVIGMTVRDIGSRLAPKRIKSEFMAFYASMMVIPLGVIIILFEKELKGELTVVISEKKISKNISQKLGESDINIIKKMINKLSTKEITEILSQTTNVPKKEIYNYCLELKNEK